MKVSHLDSSCQRLTAHVDRGSGHGQLQCECLLKVGCRSISVRERRADLVGKQNRHPELFD